MACWTCPHRSRRSCRSWPAPRSRALPSSTCWTCGPARTSTSPTTTWTPMSGRTSGSTCGGLTAREPRPADALAYYATLHNDGEHGGPFRYRSILTDVLGWVLEKAGGARLHDLIARLLWQPMGAEFDAEITVDAHGNAMADGGVCATLRDVGRFGLLFAAGGAAVGPPRRHRAGGAGSATPSRAPPTGRRPSSRPATRPASRPVPTTGTAGGYASRPSRSSTPPASTARTCSCTCRARPSSPSCPPGRRR